MNPFLYTRITYMSRHQKACGQIELKDQLILVQKFLQSRHSCFIACAFHELFKMLSYEEKKKHKENPTF